MYNANFDNIYWLVIQEYTEDTYEEVTEQILAYTETFVDAQFIVDSLLISKKGCPYKFKISPSRDISDSYYSILDPFYFSCELGSFDYSNYLDWCSCKEDL